MDLPSFRRDYARRRGHCHAALGRGGGKGGPPVRWAVQGPDRKTERDMHMRILAGAALIALSGCAVFWPGQGGTSRSWFGPSQDRGEPVEPGARIYATNCAGCHGAKGRGDGALATDLPVAPPDLTGLTLANGGVFPAERVMETIHGYPGKFHRGSMPEFAAELSGPVVEWRAPSGEVIMTPKGLLDVVAHIEGLQVAADG